MGKIVKDTISKFIVINMDCSICLDKLENKNTYIKQKKRLSGESLFSGKWIYFLRPRAIGERATSPFLSIK